MAAVSACSHWLRPPLRCPAPLRNPRNDRTRSLSRAECIYRACSVTRPPFFPREFLHALCARLLERLSLFLSLLSRIGTDEIEWKGRRNRFEPCGEFILIRSYSADSSAADSKKLISLLAISILVAAFNSGFYPFTPRSRKIVRDLS